MVRQAHHGVFFWLKSFLEKIDDYRDRLLFPFIKKYWPKCILPNHLSVVRIILAVVLIVLLLTGFQNRAWLIVIFLVAAILDLFDGSVARALDKKSQVGAFLDSLADKILILPIAIYILIKDYFWLLVFLILPELISGLGAVYCKSTKRVLKATIFGKTKMVLESVAFAVIICFDFPYSPSRFPIILLWIAVVFAFFNIILNILVPPPKTKDAP